VQKYFYSFDEFKNDLNQIKPKLVDYNPDAILSIARGGATYGHFISEVLNNRNLFFVNSISYNDTQKLDSIDIFNIPQLSNYKKILIVDDICDSGDTLLELLKILNKKYENIEFKTTTIFYKKDAKIEVDFGIKEANCWINFFWEA
jgi:xanthine phosphoribosyltransferase